MKLEIKPTAAYCVVKASGDITLDIIIFSEGKEHG